MRSNRLRLLRPRPQGLSEARRRISSPAGPRRTTRSTASFRGSTSATRSRRSPRSSTSTRSSSRLRPLLRGAGGEAAGVGHRGRTAVRNLARLLVGRALALHLLRPQRRHHVLPGAAGRDGAQAPARCSSATASRAPSPSRRQHPAARVPHRRCCRSSTRRKRTASSMRSRPTSRSARWRCWHEPG